ncbi:hypothetical protein BgiBS90_007627 [Biomphalaria glabrata]|nr:hypothetical protein BgiBS90_007627 [Biomphalaria glabrata]
MEGWNMEEYKFYEVTFVFTCIIRLSFQIFAFSGEIVWDLTFYNLIGVKRDPSILDYFLITTAAILTHQLSHFRLRGMSSVLGSVSERDLCRRCRQIDLLHNGQSKTVSVLVALVTKENLVQ